MKPTPKFSDVWLGPGDRTIRGDDTPKDRPAPDTARNALVLVVIGVLVFGAAQYAMRSTKPGDGKALPMETANHAGYQK